jgi:hypothetical protein
VAVRLRSLMLDGPLSTPFGTNCPNKSPKYSEISQRVA